MSESAGVGRPSDELSSTRVYSAPLFSYCTRKFWEDE